MLDDNQSRKKIVLIEDNQGDIELFKQALAEYNFNIELITLTNGEETIDFLNQLKENFEADDIFLVVADLNLPDISGYLLIKEIRFNSVLFKVPINVFTTSTNPTDINRAMRNGANAYTYKPIDLDNVFKTVTTMVDFWKNVNIL